MSRKPKRQGSGKGKGQGKRFHAPEPGARISVPQATPPYAGRQVPLERIDDCRWRVPRSGPMHVDGIVYAREDLLPDLREDRCLEQVANVATLPGIVGHSLAMPDIHWGYGFPIGGVAAFDPQTGVVSPGGVGYDINCLSRESAVSTALGYTLPIGAIVEERRRESLALLDPGQARLERAGVVAGLAKAPGKPVLSLETTAGRSIVGTSDHLFLTPEGMRPLGDLAPGDRVATLSWEGVPWEAPSGEVIVSEQLVRQAAARLGKTNAGNALAQALSHLRDLLPLTFDHPALPVLLKVAGYVLGDGSIHVSGAARKVVVSANGKAEDLERMASDLRPWFKASRVYRRRRACEIDTTYGKRRFHTTEQSVRLGKGALGLLLAAMGLPVGKKPAQAWELPAWLFRAPRWQQRLFLAGFFGAELSTPRPVPAQGTCFQCPVLSQNKRLGFEASGERFLRQVADLLAGFGVTALTISARNEQTNRDGSRSVRQRLVLGSTSADLIALWGRVGFEYNAWRARQAAWAVAYLRAKEQAREGRERVRRQILDLRARHGWGARKIHAALGASAFNLRFVERTIYADGEREVRSAAGYPRFEAWVRAHTEGLGESGATWETVAAMAPRPEVERVYDITVDHGAHTFLANGFVVHNCGVRFLSSDLTAEQVRPRLRELTEALYQAIPSGVGSTRDDVRLGEQDLERVLRDGAHWAREKGYASAADVEHLEENGRLPNADPARVSKRARARGHDQLGTLGSGNHFAEVGVIDEVHDEAAARALGLRLGQVTLMIHSGSRGLGHQVCTDSLEDMLRAAGKYGIPLVDRQLCCAPIDSPEAQAYLGAMAAAANFAFANRQLMAHWARQVFRERFQSELTTVYDVCHNIAKFETHPVDGQPRRLLVHRKGATRALPPGHPLVPAAYREVGQPVIIPGDMGRYSFVLLGGERSADSFGSACHGAGRVLSRHEAKRRFGGGDVAGTLERERGVIVRGASRATVVEEVPEAYKDVAQVVDVVDSAGLARKVVRVRPLGVVKG